MWSIHAFTRQDNHINPYRYVYVNLLTLTDKTFQ